MVITILCNISVSTSPSQKFFNASIPIYIIASSGAVLLLIIIFVVIIMLVPVVIIKMRKKGDVNIDLNMPQSTQPETMLGSVEIYLQENVAYGQVGLRK